MPPSTDLELSGTHGRLVVRCWRHPAPRFVALIAHGFGEHSGRYLHVAERLVGEGAAVFAPDHAGHGRSDGARAKIGLVEDMVSDLRAVYDVATAEYPGLPAVLVGHSMGGIIATRFVQRYGADRLAALVLSGPAIGGNPALAALLQMDPLPDVPIDPGTLSRDPGVGKAYQDDPLVYHGALERATLEAWQVLVPLVAGGGRLGDLPTLWLHGDEDMLAPLPEARAAIERIRGSALETRIYPGARHEVFNETNAAEVLAHVVEFIERQLVTPARR